MGKRLYIGNLAYSASVTDLRAVFSKAGQVLDVFIPRTAGAPDKNMGYAFVEMGTKLEAKRALSLLNGKPGPFKRPMTVKYADSREDPQVTSQKD